MIRVEVHEISDRIIEFSVSGHAHFAESGMDIVCAAVSALVLNAINSCEKLLGVNLPIQDDGDTLSCAVPETERMADVQLLLHSMLFGLEQTAEQCRKFVRIRVYHDK